MKRIDLFTHVLPRPFLDFLARRAGGLPASVESVVAMRSCLSDMDERRRVMDRFDDYV